MLREYPLSEKLRAAGITICTELAPGDLGQLIELHGVQNFRDYGFGVLHEAYCARIASDFLLREDPGRSRLWLAKCGEKVAGSVLIVDHKAITAQLRLLFVDRALRGFGLGRWLASAAVVYSEASGFEKVFLWTVAGLNRAIGIYESIGFRKTVEKQSLAWGNKVIEICYERTFSGKERSADS